MTPEQMADRLKNQFPEAEVHVIDLTGTQDHYQVNIKSSVFAGKNRLQQQRLIMDVFAAELKSGEVHALTIKTEVQ